MTDGDLRSQLVLRRTWLAVGWLLVAAVLYLSLTPFPPPLPPFANSDKFEHALAYLVLMLWFAQLYPSSAARWRVAFLLVALGVLIEYLQGWSGYRDFDYLDMVADAVGVALGWALAISPLGRSVAWADHIGRRLLHR